MKVILLQDVDKLGEAGEVVTVKNGFGRNYLIPKRLASLATKSSIKAWEEERRQASRKLKKTQEDAAGLARELESMELIIPAKMGEDNRIFGTVTPQQVAISLATQGLELDRRKISIDEEIRMIGVYTATVKLHPEVSAKVKLNVVPAKEDYA